MNVVSCEPDFSIVQKRQLKLWVIWWIKDLEYKIISIVASLLVRPFLLLASMPLVEYLTFKAI